MYSCLKQNLFSREFHLILQWIDSSANKSDFGDQRDSIIMKTFLRERRVRAVLYIGSKSVRLWKIFIEEIFITFWNICCAHYSRFDRWRVALTTLSATREIRPLYDEWNLWEREANITSPRTFRTEAIERYRAWFISCLANMMNML